MIILEHLISHQKVILKNTIAVFAKYELWWCIIFIQVIKYRSYILITENFASDFPEILSRSLFYMKRVDKADWDLRSNPVE